MKKLRIFRTKKSFKKEFKRQLKFALIAAIGFTIAFAWKETIYNRSRELMEVVTESAGKLSDFYTSLFITLVGVILIGFLSRVFKN